MPITYPRNTESRYALYDKSLGEILKQDTKYNRADGGEIEGGDPDLVYLEIKDGNKPSNDTFYYDITSDYVIDVENGEYRKEYTATKKGQEELTELLEGVEYQANQSVCPQRVQNKLILLGLSILLKNMGDVNLVPRDTVVKNRIIDLSTKLLLNDKTLKNKLEELNAGYEPDTKTGWTTE